MAFTEHVAYHRRNIQKVAVTAPQKVSTSSVVGE
jgi:hypothetical protein